MDTNARSATRGSQPAVTTIVCVALATVVSAMASLNVALPDIARSTHANQTQLEWVIDAYSLVFAAMLLPGGAIGDRYGRRRALIIGLIIFGAGSAAAMAAGSAGQLIALRGVLGLGAALVMPATLSTITSTLAEDQRAKAVGVWAGVAGGAAVIGLLASGALLHVWSWQSVFALNVVLAVAALAGVIRCVPESADPDAPPLDIKGAILAVLALVTLVFSVIEAPDHGWLSVRTLSGLGIATAVMVAFVGVELTQDHPMLDPRVFRSPRLAAGSMSIFVQFFAFYGFTFISLQYLQIVRGNTPLRAAVSVLPMATMMVILSRLTPTIAARLSARWVCSGGLGLIAVAMVILSNLSTTSPYLLFASGLIVLGVGMGAAMTPATSGITEALPDNQQGVGSAINDLSRELGGAIGIALIGSILDATYRSHLHLPGAPTSVLHRAQGSLAVAQGLGGGIAAHAHTAFVSGLHLALLCGGGAAGAAAIGVIALLSSRRRVAADLTGPVAAKAGSPSTLG